MKGSAVDLNNPGRYNEIRSIVDKKYSLKSFYLEVYQKYADCISRSPSPGIVLEIGSGAGFVKEIIPEIITSDVLPYPNVDYVMDATRLDFPDKSLACICMFNVLHHIPDTPAFFHEATRCLLPGGRLFMVEPYAGWISSWVFKHLHHEDFDLNVSDWKFESNGPVSDANNALPTIIFERDVEKFRQTFTELEIIKFAPHSPLKYWLTGGLQKWSLLPQWAFSCAGFIDKTLIRLTPKLGSFVDIELIRT